MTSVWGKKSLGDGLLVQTYLLGDRISVKVVVEVRRRSTSMIKLRVLFSLKKLKFGGVLKQVEEDALLTR